MSPVRVTWGRTIGMARNMFSTALAVCGFLSAASVLFAFNLEGAEGARLTIAALWTVSVAPLLPILASFLAMDVWSDELQTGRMEILLSSSVHERDYVIGKYLGVYTMLMLTVIFFMAMSLTVLAVFSPLTLKGATVAMFGTGFFSLALQGALWCAVGMMTSVCFHHSAAAAFTSLVLTVGLPRGIWAALMAWAPQGRVVFGEMPLDAHALDFALGIFPSWVVMMYVILTATAMFITSKIVVAYRFVGRKTTMSRLGTGFVISLSLVAATLAIMLAVRLNTVIELPVTNSRSIFSARTRGILSDSSGDISITCFLRRSDTRFRATGHLLRLFKRESEALGGARLTLRFVDPRWDLGAAERLVRLGAQESSVIFEKGGRMAIVAMDDEFGERICASTLHRVSTPPQRRNIYWTSGHGEGEFDGYGAWGMSDIARDLSMEGYRNLKIDLSADAQIPTDCALIVIAGAKDEFSRIELGRIDTYLKNGGRVLAMLSSLGQGGITSLLPSWGIRPVDQTFQGVRTFSGSDVIVSDFTDHAISSLLKGSQIVLERPKAFVPSAVAEGGAGADKVEFTSVAKIGPSAVVAAIERGAGTGSDLAMRPTRIVAIGDASFVMNGQLLSRANANRDFFLNCIAYLSGTDASAASGSDAKIFVTAMDRFDRLHFILISAAIVPGLILLIMVVTIIRRRRIQ